MKKSIRPVLEALLITGLMLAAVLWLSGGCRDRVAPIDGPEAEPDAGTAALVPVEEVVVTAYEQVSGTVSSARHTTISSKILARIEAIAVRSGDEVEAGTLVARLDSRDLAARLQAAREEVSSARAALDLARSERERIAGLHASRVASRQQLDRAEAALRIALATVEQSEQRARDAEVGLSYSEIRAPAAGRVIDRLAEPGDTIAPGAPLLRIYDPSAMRLEAPVRESLATRLRPGELIRVRVESIGLDLDGAIDEIVPAAAPGARTFLVKIRLPSEPRLYAGMYGRATIPAGSASLLAVSEDGIDRIGQLAFATVVDADGRSARRLLTTGPAIGGGRVEVLSGLAAGERVRVR